MSQSGETLPGSRAVSWTIGIVRFTFAASRRYAAYGAKTRSASVQSSPGTLTAKGPGSASSSRALRASTSKKHKKKPLILPASVHATKAGPVQITISLSAAGKAKLLKHGKLTVPVTLTFTPTGGTPSSQTRAVTFKKKKPHAKK